MSFTTKKRGSHVTVSLISNCEYPELQRAVALSRANVCGCSRQRHGCHGASSWCSALACMCVPMSVPPPHVRPWPPHSVKLTHAVTLIQQILGKPTFSSGFTEKMTLEGHQLLSDVPCHLLLSAQAIALCSTSRQSQSGLHQLGCQARIPSGSHHHCTAEAEHLVVARGWGRQRGAPLCPSGQKPLCHRYMLLQHEKQKDPKASKPVSVAFLVELRDLTCKH